MNTGGTIVRVSVTLSDEVNKLITEHAKKGNISKDKLISGIVEDWVKMCRDLNTTVKHNARGAGRKKQYSDAHKLAMKAYKANGMSYRDIAKIYDCSVGTVCKLINEQ